MQTWRCRYQHTCPADINTPSQNMLVSAYRRRGVPSSMCQIWSSVSVFRFVMHDCSDIINVALLPNVWRWESYQCAIVRVTVASSDLHSSCVHHLWCALEVHLESGWNNVSTINFVSERSILSLWYWVSWWALCCTLLCFNNCFCSQDMLTQSTNTLTDSAFMRKQSLPFH